MADITGHTPGPWYAAYSKTNEFPGGNIRSNHHRHGEGALLFQTGPMFHDYTPDREEELANLRLAASAPDLLDALEIIAKLLVRADSERIVKRQIQGIRDVAICAISKAKEVNDG